MQISAHETGATLYIDTDIGLIRSDIRRACAINDDWFPWKV